LKVNRKYDINKLQYCRIIRNQKGPLLWKNAKTRKIIAYLFFALAFYDILRIIILKFPSPVVTNHSAYSSGYALGWMTGFYLAPVIFAFIGWLFFRSGKKLQEAAGDGLATN